MSFINDNIPPTEATQGGLLFDGHFKACNTNIKFPSSQQLFTYMFLAKTPKKDHMQYRIIN
jgi:hypothetical protein